MNASTPARLEFVVAVAENGVIGLADGLPWRLPADLRHFKEVTWGYPLLMGRRTFDSIGRPLPGRENLVLTRNSGWRADGVRVVRSLAEARAAGPVLMVIGGADIFRLCLQDAAVIHLTEVHARPAGDVYFPPLRREDYAETSRERHARDAKNEYDFSFVRLERRAGN
jgi:dihydrofolate reductase